MQASESDSAIEAHVRSLDGSEIEGGWKLLCTNVLVKAACALQGAILTSKESLRQYHQARKWVFGGTGIITFEEACFAVGIDPSYARNRIVSGTDDGSINRLRMPSVVFGRQTNDDFATLETPCGVVASNFIGDEGYGGQDEPRVFFGFD